MKWRAYRAEIWFHSEFSSCVPCFYKFGLLIFAKEKIPIPVILGWKQRSSEMPSISWIIRVSRSVPWRKMMNDMAQGCNTMQLKAGFVTRARGRSQDMWLCLAAGSGTCHHFDSFTITWKYQSSKYWILRHSHPLRHQYRSLSLKIYTRVMAISRYWREFHSAQSVVMLRRWSVLPAQVKALCCAVPICSRFPPAET